VAANSAHNLRPFRFGKYVHAMAGCMHHRCLCQPGHRSLRHNQFRNRNPSPTPDHNAAEVRRERNLNLHFLRNPLTQLFRLKQIQGTVAIIIVNRALQIRRLGR
jgi:hypothetical protein